MTATDIKTIKLPLSFAPFSSNAYLVRTKNSNILFDTGANSDECLKILKKEIEDFGGIDAIIISHGHLDHAGCANIISNEFEVPVYASLKEKERLSEDIVKRLERRVKKTIKLLNFFGFSDETALKELEKANFYKNFMQPVEFIFNFSYFKDPEIDIIELPGHTDGSIALFIKKEKLMLTGDALLKEGISSFFDPESIKNSLESYLRSIKKINELEPALVYPGHENPFDCVASVVEEHINYVELISEKINEAINNNNSIRDTIPKFFPKTYNALVAISEIVYAFEKANIEILQSLKDLLSE